VLRIFIALKIHRLGRVLNPKSLGPVASTVTTIPPRRSRGIAIVFIVRLEWCVLALAGYCPTILVCCYVSVIATNLQGSVFPYVATLLVESCHNQMLNVSAYLHVNPCSWRQSSIHSRRDPTRRLCRTYVRSSWPRTTSNNHGLVHVARIHVFWANMVKTGNCDLVREPETTQPP
jgi:hypothetical protein